MKKTIGMITGGGSTNYEVLRAEKPGGELYGITKTVAIISSVAGAGGIEKAKSLHFDVENIYTLNKKDPDFLNRLLGIFGVFKPDFFHQLGWLPRTPLELIDEYQGLNQHLGPGGRHMFGKCRIWTHIEFCKRIGRAMPIPVFCQLVHPEYDEGGIVYMEQIEVDLTQDIQTIADILLPIEHRVQIRGRKMFATGEYNLSPVPKYALIPEEELLLRGLKSASRKVFPNG